MRVVIFFKKKFFLIIMAAIFILLLQILLIYGYRTSEDLLKVHYPLFGISELAANPDTQKCPCQNQMKNIYYALKKRETWALRLLDSSGAPKNGFIWGNNYWLGTYSQCRWVSSKQAVLPSKGASSKLEFPPFSVDFYVASFNHNSSYQARVKVPQENLILIGLCLPSVCSVENLEPLLASWSAQSVLNVQHLYNFSMKLHNIRVIKEGAATDYPLVIVFSLELTTYTWFFGYFAAYHSEKKDSKRFANFSSVGILSGLKTMCNFITGSVIFLAIFATLYEIYIWQPNCIEYTSKNPNNKSEVDKIRNIRESDELLNRDNNLDDGYELKVDNSLHKSIPMRVHVDTTLEGQSLRRRTERDLKRFFMCFSVATNIKSFMDINYNKDNVPAIHGLRFVAMIWIICMYTLYYLKDFADNKPLLLRVSQGFSEQVISNSTFSVDTFFFTSGFLLSYIYYRNRRGLSDVSDSCSIKKKVNEFCSMFLYRFIRLTPAYVFVLIIANMSIKRNNRMSLFEVTELSQNVCEKYWWRNLLYINNLFKADEMCMSWSWYLSTEMQFFVIGSVILILSTRFWKFSVGLIASLLLLASLINGYLSYSYGFAPTLDHQLSYLSVLHYPPWARIGPYLIGICTGYFAIYLKGKLVCNKATLITCWVVGSMSNLWALFGLYNKDMSIISTALYNALSRPAWGFGLSWIVIACTTNNAGILNSIFSFGGWIPLSKLSFTAYLLSPIIINLTYSSSETPIHLDFFPVVVYFFGFIGLTYSSAAILSLMIELPCNQIGKYLIRRKHAVNQLNQQ